MEDNCTLNNIEDDNSTINRRRSMRKRHRNTLYTSNEDNTIENNETDIDENCHIQEPSSSTSIKVPSSEYNMQKKKVNDPMGQVLINMGLYDELYEFLKSNDITVEALKYMQTRHIDELFKGARLGTKIIFEHRLKIWQSKYANCDVITKHSVYNNINSEGENTALNINPHAQILPEAHLTSLTNLLTNAVQQTINTVMKEYKSSYQSKEKFNGDLSQELPAEAITLKNIKVEKSFDETNDKSSIKDINIAASSKSKRRKLDSDVSVQDILIASPEGQMLIDEYEETRLLTPSLRNELVRCIVDHYIRNKRSMSVLCCKEIAEEIVELFPTESLETYFSQENKQKSPKGKIWERYQSRRRSIRKHIATRKETSPLTLDTTPLDEEEIVIKTDWSTMEIMCTQMKHIVDEKEILEKWKESFDFRRYQLQTGWFENWKLYFDEYPFCKQQNYAQFIESDLENLYPNLKFNDFLWDDFMNNFSTYFSNRIKHAKTKSLYEQLISTANLNTESDYVAVKIIDILHAVLRSQNTKLPSLEDVQRKFTVEVSDLADLKKEVIERKRQCTENNIQAKPYIAVVGQNKLYNHFSVIIDSTGFSCDNFKDSLILCFNLYLFFDISFPAESLNVWTFIQKYFFNKPPLVSNPRVDAFINDIKGLKHRSSDMNELK